MGSLRTGIGLKRNRHMMKPGPVTIRRPASDGQSETVVTYDPTAPIDLKTGNPFGPAPDLELA